MTSPFIFLHPFSADPLAQCQPISHQTTHSPSLPLRSSARVLAALNASLLVIGSGSSRLFAYNHAHAALLFNSDFDTYISQPGDVLPCDAATHASVHESACASRVAPCFGRLFVLNDVRALRALRAECVALEEAESSVFVLVESVYSMVGTARHSRDDR